jgi:hypothetical protein
MQAHRMTLRARIEPVRLVAHLDRSAVKPFVVESEQTEKSPNSVLNSPAHRIVPYADTSEPCAP